MGVYMKYYFRKILYKLAKKFIRLFVIISIVISLVIINIYHPLIIYASSNDNIIDNLTNYVLASSGAISVKAEEVGNELKAIVSQPSNVYDRLKQKISDLLGTGIYLDSNNNYVFSGSATNEIYNVLGGFNPERCRVVSDWGGITANSALSYANTPYTNYLFTDKLNEYRGLFSDYLIASSQLKKDGNYYTFLVVIDLSNVGFLGVGWSSSDNSLYVYLYGTDGNYINCNYYSCMQSYISSTSTYSSINTTNNVRTSNNIRVIPSINSIGSYFQPNSSIYETDLFDILPINSFQTAFNGFPYFVNDGTLFWSNHSCIYAWNNTVGNSYINNNNNIYVSNTYINFPSIPSNTINNNNWNNIYNNYLQNISNNSNQYITNNGINKKQLQNLMGNYTNTIINAIEEGNENIEQAIFTTNEWLQRIYDRLGQIYDLLLLNDDGGGSGGSSSANVDLSRIESYLSSMNTNITNLVISLNRLESNLPNYSAQLASQYTLLSNIYQALLNIGSGGGSGGGGDNIYIPPTDNPWEPYFHVIDDLPVETYNDIINEFDVIKQLLNEVAPFVYLGMISGILNRLNVPAQEPIFTIPVTMENDFIDIDEDIVIDLTIFEDILPIIQGVFMIGFILSLIWLSAWFVPHILQMFDF